MKYIEVVAAVIKDNDKFLCAQRKDNKFKYLAFKFEFPGGKIEANETFEDCLRREIKEELSASIHSISFLMDVYHDYPDFSVHITFFECAIDKNKIALLDHKKIIWKAAKELKTLDWAEADLPVVNLLSHQ
ncbi:(deoxy)nucleoside triphosphate pyrophosphohydrolase [Acinetobacter soli]|uniref:(deoxy)nucleoside triphosphate pyrophosphohydrolase n=1 Tax=Acinetobacter soli TaxID=487316 RepID=UPI0004696D6A|nr:(deoxy)nucleoside triphosphate pyrophosphohydrolase [Acinetobacter soli]